MSIFNKQSGKEEIELQEDDRDFKELKVLEMLHKTISGSTLTRQGVCIEELNLIIDTRTPHVNGAVVQLMFILKHKMFEEEFIESVVGVGPTFENAIEEGIKNFSISVLDGVIKALRNEKGERIKVNILDKTHSFTCYKSMKIQQGSILAGESIDFWDLLKEDIVTRMGNKKVYLVKVYAAKSGDTISCECRINGMLYPNFTKKLDDRVTQWRIKDTMYSERQFFVLIQDEMSYIPYPLTKKEVESYTLNALLLYRECISEDDYKELFDRILEVCPNKSLATELYSLIPEIITEIIFSDVNYSDELLLVRGEERHHLFRHQLTSYDWIYNVVERTIRAGYFEKSQIDPIIRCSTSLNSIQEALNKGSQMKSISMLGIGIPVPLEYEVL